MAHLTSALSRWLGAGILCAALLSSPGAIASPSLYAMATGQGFGQSPVAIDPITGTETVITPGESFGGSAFDLVAAGGTLYILSSTFPSIIQ